MLTCAADESSEDAQNPKSDVEQQNWQKSGSEYNPSELSPAGSPELQHLSQEEVDLEPPHDDPELEAMRLSEIALYNDLRSNPISWADAYGQLHTLRMGQYIEAVCANPPLMTAWWRQRSGDPPCIYISFPLIWEVRCRLVRGMGIDPGPVEEGTIFRHYASIAQTITSRKVVFLMMKGADIEVAKKGVVTKRVEINHFFAVLFDYDLGEASIFGYRLGGEPGTSIQTTSTDPCWRSIEGPQLWEAVGRQLGWIVDPDFLGGEQILISRIDWPQVLLTNLYESYAYSLSRMVLIVGPTLPLCCSNLLPERSFPPVDALTRRNTSVGTKLDTSYWMESAIPLTMENRDIAMILHHGETSSRRITTLTIYYGAL